MNMIGFIFSIILIITCMCANFWQKSTYSYREAKDLLEEGSQVRIKHNEAVQSYFNKIKNIKNSLPNKNEKPNKDLVYKKKELFPECCRFNLYKGKTEKQDQTIDLFYRFFLYHYKELFEQEKIEIQSFFHDFIAIANEQYQTDSHYFHFGKIHFSDPKKQRLFYLIMKGSPDYFLTFEGIFPLESFIKIDPKSTKICVPCLSFQHLEAIFSFPIAKQLWQRKKEPMDQLVIRKDELEQIVNRNKSSFSSWELLQFYHLRK